MSPVVPKLLVVRYRDGSIVRFRTLSSKASSTAARFRAMSEVESVTIKAVK